MPVSMRCRALTTVTLMDSHHLCHTLWTTLFRQRAPQQKKATTEGTPKKNRSSAQEPPLGKPLTAGSRRAP